jgi:hypothetical protein
MERERVGKEEQSETRQELFAAAGQLGGARHEVYV